MAVGGELHEINMNGFDETVGVLLKGVVLGYKYAVPHMTAQKSGSIISTASVAGLQAGYGPLAYSACKAAVHHFALRRVATRTEFCALQRHLPRRHRHVDFRRNLDPQRIEEHHRAHRLQRPCLPGRGPRPSPHR